MKKLLLLSILLGSPCGALAANIPALLPISTSDRSQMKEETLSPLLPDLDADPAKVGALRETLEITVCSAVFFSRGS